MASVRSLQSQFLSVPKSIMRDTSRFRRDGATLLAVLSLATMDEAPRIEAEIARTTTFIYGIFAALGLILLGIGVLFAARVAQPILELIQLPSA